MAEDINKNTQSSGAKKPVGGADKQGNNAGRPSVIPLSYPDKENLQKAYMPFCKGGGLFFPTNTDYKLNEEIFLLVTLPGAPKSLPVPGVVVWKSPSGVGDGRRPGVGVEFKGREGNALRNRIEGTLGAKVSSSTATYTM